MTRALSLITVLVGWWGNKGTETWRNSLDPAAGSPVAEAGLSAWRSGLAVVSVALLAGARGRSVLGCVRRRPRHPC